jgi:hypothetical protein
MKKKSLLHPGAGAVHNCRLLAHQTTRNRLVVKLSEIYALYRTRFRLAKDGMSKRVGDKSSPICVQSHGYGSIPWIRQIPYGNATQMDVLANS